MLGRLMALDRVRLPGGVPGAKVKVAFVRSSDLGGMASLLSYSSPPPST